MTKQETIISNKIIRQFDPCYDPSKVMPEGEMELLTAYKKYGHLVPKKDIVWMLINLLDDKQQRLFAVWCAREALKLIENPDIISPNTCNVAERFANGEATEEELNAAWDASNAASNAARNAARDAGRYAAWAASSTASSAAWAAASAARYAAWAASSTASSAARAAASAASNAAWAASSAAWDAAWAASSAADSAVAEAAAWAAAMEAQIEQLLTYFK